MCLRSPEQASEPGLLPVPPGRAGVLALRPERGLPSPVPADGALIFGARIFCANAVCWVPWVVWVVSTSSRPPRSRGQPFPPDLLMPGASGYFPKGAAFYHSGFFFLKVQRTAAGGGVSVGSCGGGPGDGFW